MKKWIVYRIAAVPALLFCAALSVAEAANSGFITTIAGNGVAAFGGDGGPATGAALYNPVDVVVDAAGNVFVADASNNRIRRIAAGTGIITTVAGNGTAGFSGDGGTATDASLWYPSAIALDAAGNLFIAEVNNDRVRRVDAVTGIITTVAGNGIIGFSGDGGPATRASLFYPLGVAIDSQGNLFIADSGNQRIRRVDAATGMITTSAGNGTTAFSGDGGPATAAGLNCPSGLALDAAGNLFIADQNNGAIRRVDASSGLISTVAGTGAPTVWPYFSTDGGAATSTSLYYPMDVAVDTSGNLFIAEGGSNRIRRVDAVTTIMSTVAGNGTAGFAGDGGPATIAMLSSPNGVAVDSAGDLFIADQMNNRIREVIPQPTGTSVSSNYSQVSYGQAITFTAVVSPNAATGSVQFFDSGILLGKATLNSGSASLSTSSLTAGTHSISAVYSGDAVYLGSTSAAWSQSVAKAATTTSVSSNLNPSRLGQAVTFTANVAPAAATGAVQFFDGSASLATVPVSGGVASLTTTTLAAGTHSITAAYGGDPNYNGSTSAVWTQTVNAGTSTTLYSSLNPSTYSQTVTFTANVSPSSATGAVSFLDGSTVLGTISLSTGTAAFSTGALAAGSHSITAKYSGDAYDNPSTSPAVSQNVNPAATATIVTSSANPSIVKNPVTFTATVSPASATGTVQFLDGTNLIGTQTLNNGIASLTTSSLSVGTHSITARYSGSSNYTGSASPVLSQTVKRK